MELSSDYSTNTDLDELIITEPRAALQKELMRIIQPWTMSENQHPFSMTELIIIALVFKPNSTIYDIRFWIMETFFFYRQQIYKCLKDISSPSEPNRVQYLEFWDFCELVGDIFDKFEVPLRNELFEPASFKVDLNVARWNVKPSEARIFLSNHLLPRADEQSDVHGDLFQTLPVELRHEILSLLLSFPKCGLSLEKQSGRCPPVLHTLTRDYNDVSMLKEWDFQYPGFEIRGLFSRRLPDVLNVLLVCKRFYAEAMPVFYKANSFYCRSIEDLANFLKYTPLERLHHIRHIGFSPKQPRTQLYNSSKAPGSFRVLGEMRNLRRLDVFLDYDEDCLRELYPEFDMSQIQIRGLPTLKKVDVEDIRFFGSNRRLIEHLNETFAQIKQENRLKGSKPKDHS